MCKNLVMIKSSGIFKNKSFTSLIDLLFLELFNITFIWLIQEFICFLLI